MGTRAIILEAHITASPQVINIEYLDKLTCISEGGTPPATAVTIKVSQDLVNWVDPPNASLGTPAVPLVVEGLCWKYAQVTATVPALPLKIYVRGTSRS
jgi:hypothetical protein